MGLCRAFNLLLGMSILGTLEMLNVSIAVIPLVYIAAVTLISQGEVSGGNTRSVLMGLGVYVLVEVMIGSLVIVPGFSPLQAAPYGLIFILLTMPAAWTAYKKKESAYVMHAVKMGVLALIPLNATLAAGFSGWIIGLLLLLLLPLSLLTARVFAVT